MRDATTLATEPSLTAKWLREHDCSAAQKAIYVLHCTNNVTLTERSNHANAIAGTDAANNIEELIASLSLTLALHPINPLPQLAAMSV